MAKNQKKSTSAGFDNVLNLLREDPRAVFEKYGRTLSDLRDEKLTRLQAVLNEIPAEKRAEFFRAMEEFGEENVIYNYTQIAFLGVKDAYGDARAASLRILSYEDSGEIGEIMLNAALNDPCEEAQLTAIEVLGEYMNEADMEEPIPVSKKKLYRTLSMLLDSPNKAVRRAAVVAYAVSGDKRVRDMISGYLAGSDPDELITGLSAIRFSMIEDWNDSLLELLENDNEEVRKNAFRTAGTLELKQALPALYDTIAEFDRVSPELLLAAVNAVAEIGDESSLDVLETLGEAAVDMDSEIVDTIDDCIDTLNMSLNLGISPDDDEWDEDDDDDNGEKLSPEEKEELREKIEDARERCLSILEEKIPHDLEDDEPADPEEDDDDDCECGDHPGHHHHHHHDNPLEGLDLSRFRILDDLEAYESDADTDEDEDDLWAEFEEMNEEDLDADSLRDFIEKLEKRKKDSQ